MSLGPLQVNARLSAVSTATAATGGRDDWDEEEGVEPDGAGTAKWTGDAPAYYREEIDHTEQGDVIVRRTLWLQTAVARAAGIDTDDVLTIINPNGDTVSIPAVAIAYSDARERGSYAAPLASPEVETTKLELQPA